MEQRRRRKKKKKTNPSPSLLSLPHDIIVNCIARISRSYYPKLSLVCKTFCSLVSSKEVSRARSHLGTDEYFFHICIQFCRQKHPSWFTLWIKPDKTLTNGGHLDKDKKSTTNNRLVPIPSSCYYPRVPSLIVRVGSESYAFRQKRAPSSVMRFRKEGVGLWRKTHMPVARGSPFAGVVNEKIYVMGGGVPSDYPNWAESFDPKTQTWEPLPDPGADLRSSKIEKLEVIDGKLYITNNTMTGYVYDPKEGKWNVSPKAFIKWVSIDKTRYTYLGINCLLYITKGKKWKAVRGLDMNPPPGGMIEMVNYGGKLLMLWESEFSNNRHSIYCEMIAFERRNGDEVWGNVEWANVVLTSRRSIDFVRTQVSKI